MLWESQDLENCEPDASRGSQRPLGDQEACWRRCEGRCPPQQRGRSQLPRAHGRMENGGRGEAVARGTSQARANVSPGNYGGPFFPLYSRAHPVLCPLHMMGQVHRQGMGQDAEMQEAERTHPGSPVGSEVMWKQRLNSRLDQNFTPGYR